MSAMPEWIIIGSWVAALAVGAAALARLFRNAGAPGGWPASAALGGILAGVVLGGTVAGRLAPTWHERAFGGGEREARAVAEMESRHRAEIEALTRLDVTPVAIDEQRDAQRREMAPLLAERDEARRAHRDRWGAGWGGLAALWLLAGAAGGAKRSRRRDALAPAIGAGIGSALFAAAPAFLLLRWMTDASVETAGAFACAVAVGGAHFDARTRWSGRPGRRRGVDVAALTALAVATVALATLKPSAHIIALAAASALAAALVGLVRLPRHIRRLLRGGATGVLLPAMVAIGAAHVDFISASSSGLFWIALIIAAIFCADGRWLGGWLGWWALGRDHQWRSAWTRSSAALTGGVGGMQVALAGAALFAGALPPALLGAAILSAPALELSSGMRRRIAIGLDTGEIFQPPANEE